MKKFFQISILSVLVVFIINFTVSSNNYNPNNQQDLQQSIASKIIRFHVIANSDTKYDQALKLKVRDAILDYIAPKMKNCKDINESRKVLLENNKYILSIAQQVINNEGYNYGVKSTFSKFNFPIKTYGNITLPQGKYEAYRVVIGQGKGQNWWCVMFPPLCFVDISKGEASYEKTEKEMKSVLNQKEYNSIDNQKEYLKNNDNNSYKKVKIRFKIVDILKSIKF
jgi:stage II sporulation protein R